MKTDKWLRKKFREDAIRLMCSDDTKVMASGEHLEIVLDDLEETLLEIEKLKEEIHCTDSTLDPCTFPKSLEEKQEGSEISDAELPPADTNGSEDDKREIL